jgi:hypothetical protein
MSEVSFIICVSYGVNWLNADTETQLRLLDEARVTFEKHSDVKTETKSLRTDDAKKADMEEQAPGGRRPHVWLDQKGDKT